MNILKLYKDTDNKDVREMFLLMCLAILGLMTMITLTYIFEEGSSSYYRAQNGLFILDIIQKGLPLSALNPLLWLRRL